MSSPRKRRMRNNLRVARVEEKRANRMESAAVPLSEAVAEETVAEETVVEEAPKPTRRRRRRSTTTEE